MEEEKTTEEIPQEEEELIIDAHGRPVNRFESQSPPQIVKKEETSTEGESTEEESPKMDVLQGVYQDDRYEIPLDAQFEVTPDKKPTLKELTELYKSDHQLRARFGEIGDREKRAADKEKQLQNTMVLFHDQMSNINKAAQSGDFDGLIAGLATAMPGTDPSEFIDSLYRTLLPGLEKRMEMDEEERRAADLRRSNEWLKRSVDQRKQSLQVEEQQTRIKTQIRDTMSALGISENEVNDAAQELDKLAREGKLNSEIITRFQQATPLDRVQEIMKYAVGRKTQTRIDSVISSVDPELLKNDDLFAELYGAVTNPYRKTNLSDEDLKSRIYKFLGKTPADANGAKIDRSPDVTKEKTEERPREEKPTLTDPKTWKPVSMSDLLDPHF